ncbi:MULTISPECIES: hypothetical protein [unclassified Streptomyces]|uniref:hypothetical protein n=1 Tax=unclassified Streptomyces TaxID=2593676 RepID=UPI0037FD638B
MPSARPKVGFSRPFLAGSRQTAHVRQAPPVHHTAPAPRVARPAAVAPAPAPARLADTGAVGPVLGGGVLYRRGRVMARA